MISGGRLVSSDEVSMYLTVESLVRHGTLDIPLDNAQNATVFDGKAYTWYEAGNILLGIPLYIVGWGVSAILPVSESLRSLLPRVTVSLTSAFIGGFLAILFYSLCRRFGLSVRFSIAMVFILIFSTFLLPYFKLYLREPFLALCLLGGIYYLIPNDRQLPSTHSPLLAGSFIGFGILTKLVFMLNVVPLIGYIMWDHAKGNKRPLSQKFTEMFTFIAPIFFIGILGSGLYNFLRFGNPLDTGYPSGVGFPTPFYVGMYGLLFSSGKGLLWFAPILLCLPWALSVFWQKHKQETICILGLFTFNLILYSVYISWGGDGSWGPRYLAPLLPLLLLPAAVYIHGAARSIRKIAFVLTTIGCLVQFGSVTIYAGSYLREIGEFPFKQSFTDPEFLYKAHYIPNYSPIIGHWRMFTRNLGEHFAGEYPHLQFNDQQSGKRLPIAAEDQSKLQHTLDFWFAYALYAGISAKVIICIFIVLSILCGTSGFLLRQNLSFQFHLRNEQKH
jgi:hypothetical protein